MKKELLISLGIFTILGISALGYNTYAAKAYEFDFNLATINFTNKESDVESRFNAMYAVNYDESKFKEDEIFKERITELAKRTTYLFLGNPNVEERDYEEYISRRNETMNDLKYNPRIPTDENGDFITSSQEFKDDVFSGVTLPGMFNELTDRNIVYKGLGRVEAYKNSEYAIAKVVLEDVLMDEANEKNPRKIDRIKTNLMLTYMYKELDGEYKLYWLIGETSEDINEFFEDIENEENKGQKGLYSKYVGSLKDVYDYSKLEKLEESKIKKVYDDNISNVVMFNTYADKAIINTGVGFFLTDGIVVTNWGYVENSLKNGQFIIIKDKDNNIYDFDGFVNVDLKLDIAIIKLKNPIKHEAVLGDVDELQENDPVISISTKSGFGLSVVSGIMINNSANMKNAIPLSDTDAGSPVFNVSGEVVAMNTSKSINSGVSEATPTKYLNDIKQVLKNQKFEDIQVVSFEELKEKYYYNKAKQEDINNKLEEKVWNRYKSIGDIENTVVLDLTKSSYYNGIVSLRYRNPIIDFISNMDIIKPFMNKLEEQGYQKTYEKKDKVVYQNKDYKITIKNSIDSLIILMKKI